MLLAAPSCVVLTRLCAGLGDAAASAALATLAARGIGALALETDATDTGPFDRVVTVAADGSWSETSPQATTA
jgi:hypothetical protein